MTDGAAFGAKVDTGLSRQMVRQRVHQMLWKIMRQMVREKMVGRQTSLSHGRWSRNMVRLENLFVKASRKNFVDNSSTRN